MFFNTNLFVNLKKILKMNISKLHLSIITIITLSLTSCEKNKSEKDNSLDEVTTEYKTPTSETTDIADEPKEEISEETENKVSVSKGNNDIDAYLKSYEEYVDQYIKLMKKSKNGDMSAMTEYAEYMEKATALSEKMENAESEMSSAQMAQFLKIQAKLTQATAEMY